MDVLFYRGNYPQKSGGRFFGTLVYAQKNIQIEGSVDDFSTVWTNSCLESKKTGMLVGDLIHA